jgi:hypothetical protein
LLTNATVSQRAACAANGGARAKVNSPAFESSQIIAVDVSSVLSLGQCNPNVRSYDSRIFLSIAHTPHYQNNALVHSSHTTRLYPRKKKILTVFVRLSVYLSTRLSEQHARQMTSIYSEMRAQKRDTVGRHLRILNTSLLQCRVFHLWAFQSRSAEVNNSGFHACIIQGHARAFSTCVCFPLTYIWRRRHKTRLCIIVKYANHHYHSPGRRAGKKGVC